MLFTAGEVKQIPFQQIIKVKIMRYLFQTLFNIGNRPAHILAAKYDLTGRIHIKKLRARILKY